MEPGPVGLKPMYSSAGGQADSQSSPFRFPDGFNKQVFSVRHERQLCRPLVVVQVRGKEKIARGRNTIRKYIYILYRKHN